LYANKNGFLPRPSPPSLIHEKVCSGLVFCLKPPTWRDACLVAPVPPGAARTRTPSVVRNYHSITPFCCEGEDTHMRFAFSRFSFRVARFDLSCRTVEKQPLGSLSRPATAPVYLPPPSPLPCPTRRPSPLGSSILLPSTTRIFVPSRSLNTTPQRKNPPSYIVYVS
jgi:hypothetical protein